MNSVDKDKRVKLQLSQIIGSSALEGVSLSDEAKEIVSQVLEGALSIEDAKKAILNKYVKNTHKP